MEPTKLRLMGERILVYRRRRGWKQKHLAKRVGISLRHLGRLENGEYEPRRGTMERIARCLGVTEAMITGVEEPPMPPNVKPRGTITWDDKNKCVIVSGFSREKPCTVADIKAAGNAGGWGPIRRLEVKDPTVTSVPPEEEGR